MTSMKGYGGAPIDNSRIMETHFGGKNLTEQRGAPFGVSLRLPYWVGQPSIFRTNRKRLNGMSMLVSVLFPFIVFVVVFALMSFSFHYDSPTACWVCIALIFFASVGVCGLMFQRARVRNFSESDAEYQPMWYGFVMFSCLAAIIAAIILGYQNFDRMSKVYELNNLATYSETDPANYVGQQLVDAGRVQFSKNSYLDITKSMGFKDTDLYCVAPIVSNNTDAKTYVDFWAVGKNCCSGVAADFHCKGYQDTRGRGGLRLMDDSSRPFYRLAVQQAEATYKIKTHKPLFFVWGEDPVKYTDNLQHTAHSTFICGILAALIVQIFLVITATLVFAKVFPAR